MASEVVFYFNSFRFNLFEIGYLRYLGEAKVSSSNNGYRVFARTVLLYILIIIYTWLESKMSKYICLIQTMAHTNNSFFLCVVQKTISYCWKLKICNCAYPFYFLSKTLNLSSIYSTPLLHFLIVGISKVPVKCTLFW